MTSLPPQKKSYDLLLKDIGDILKKGRKEALECLDKSPKLKKALIGASKK